jgi:beta-galactosidase
MAVAAQTDQAQNISNQTSLRERQLLDFGWRFHFGHSNDSSKDFGFGAGRAGGFQKSGGFLSPSNLAFNDSDWKPVNLPHD